MRPLRIGLDMDGVIADIYPFWLYLLNRYHKEGLQAKDITDWNVHNFCKNATPPEVYRFLEQRGFFRFLEPMKNACEIIDLWINEGHDVSIITTCQRGQEDKRDWLEDHIQNFKKLNLYFVNGNKQRIHCDIFVDDSVSNLVKYSLEHPSSLVLCYDQHHNHMYKGSRVSNWDELRMVVNSFIINRPEMGVTIARGQYGDAIMAGKTDGQ